MIENNTVFTLHDTYYISEPQNNHQGRGSLAINPEINKRTNLISWQDTSLNPKSIRFKSIVITPNEDKVLIVTSNDKVLELVLLTVKAFKEYIRGDAPMAFQESDVSIRRYYQDYVNLSIDDPRRGG